MAFYFIFALFPLLLFLISLSGLLLAGDRFAPVAQKVGKRPVWVFHGDQDNIVPVSESRAPVRALQKIQGNVEYSEYPGVGHMVWIQALAEKRLMPWLLGQRRENNK